MPHSKDMPMPVRRLQTSLEHAMFHRFPCWCLTHEDGTMQTDCSQGLMKMERLLKAEHIVWRKAALSWMHAGVIVDASPHFARPSRVSPMDRLPHKIAVHALLLMKCNPRLMYAVYKTSFVCLLKLYSLNNVL